MTEQTLVVGPRSLVAVRTVDADWNEPCGRTDVLSHPVDGAVDPSAEVPPRAAVSSAVGRTPEARGRPVRF